MSEMNVEEFKERFIKLEMAVEAQGLILEKLNLIIVGNGKKGLAEIARDLNQISESLDRRICNIETRHKKDEEEIKEKLTKKEEERKNDIKKIVLGVIGTLVSLIVLELLRNPSLLSQLFGG